MLLLLKIVREKTGLSLMEITDFIGISRREAEDISWMVLPKEKLIKLDRLMWLRDKFTELELRRPDLIVKRPLFDGQSLLALLGQGKEIDGQMLKQVADLDQSEFLARTVRPPHTGSARDYREILDDLGGFSIDD